MHLVPRVFFASLALAAALSCKPAAHARFIEAPAGDVDALVRAQITTSAAQGRTVLVYVGASWCEPCVRFHDAAVKGELDELLARTDLLTFDLDKDAARLETAGYGSRMIPLVAVPQANGRASDRKMEGSVKGAAAIEEMRPRLRALLAP